MVSGRMCDDGVVRENEQVEVREGHEYRSWNELNGEFAMHVVERSGDGIYGPERMQSVEVTKPPSRTRLFCVSSEIPPVQSNANKRGITARIQGIEFMARSHGKY